MNQQRDYLTIVNVLARALDENNHEAERLSALSTAQRKLQSLNTSIMEMLTCRGSALDYLNIFKELRERINTLERENEALHRRHARLHPDDEGPCGITTDSWKEFESLCSVRFLTSHGHLRAQWRSEAATALRVPRRTIPVWEEGLEEVPEDILNRLREMPESPYLSLVQYDEGTGQPIIQERPYVLWSVDDLLTLSDLCKHPYSSRKIARILTEKFGRTISPEAVNFQIRSRDLRPRGFKVVKGED